MSNLKSLFGTQDMTVGRPLSVLARFSVPLLIGNFTQQLYNTADSIIVGRYIGDTALAAVGTAGPILNLLLVLFMGIATGAGILAAQYFGAKKEAATQAAVRTSLKISCLLGLFYADRKWKIRPVETLDLDRPDQAELECRALWRRFYETIAIRERYNPKCRMTHLPKRFWGEMTEFQDDPA